MRKLFSKNMFNISIVLYKSDKLQVINLLETLLQSQFLHKIYLIDNSPNPVENWQFSSDKIVYQWNDGKNLGYGAAHNIAIRESVFDDIAFHLVMNADILVRPKDLDKLNLFMRQNYEVGLVQPKILNPDGTVQHVAKLLPRPWDVFARRFLPAAWTRKSNERYELQRNKKGQLVNADYHLSLNVPYLSGCFMFLRTKAVLEAHLFDERYFMYPEDIDLTRSIHRNFLTLFLPNITIVHNHEKGSYKSFKLLWIHIVNMCRYFNKYGWLFDKERRVINRKTIDQLP